MSVTVIDTYLADNNIKLALTECISQNKDYLGLLLGQVSNTHDKYPELYKQMEKNTKGILKEGKIISETINKLEKCIGDLPKFDSDNTTLKLLCNWTTSEQLTKIWNKMSKGNYQWNNLQLITGDTEPDYYVVINAPPSGFKLDKSKTIVFRMEPNMDKHPKQWKEWSKLDESEFKKVFSHEGGYHNNIEWHINKTYMELKSMVIEKSIDMVLSTVLSSKYRDPGHIKRVDFIKFLDTKEDINVDVFGDNKWDYKNFKGSLPYHNKDKALFPYKYCFNVENNNIENYFTEKLVDGILAECLVFYHGCSNIRQYLPDDSYVWLELSNFEMDYQKIKKAIEEDWWSKRIDKIREAKKLILDKYQFFPRLEKELVNLNK